MKSIASKRLVLSHCLATNIPLKQKLAANATSLLSAKVVKSLPKTWQGINTLAQAKIWLDARFKESEVFSIEIPTSNEIIGLVFIHGIGGGRSGCASSSCASSGNESAVGNRALTVHLGYLIAENYWGKGYASEVLAALVLYFSMQAQQVTLMAGVENDNFASIKVLQKCGFVICEQPSQVKQGSLFYQQIV